MHSKSDPSGNILRASFRDARRRTRTRRRVYVLQVMTAAVAAAIGLSWLIAHYHWI